MRHRHDSASRRSQKAECHQGLSPGPSAARPPSQPSPLSICLPLPRPGPSAPGLPQDHPTWPPCFQSSRSAPGRWASEVQRSVGKDRGERVFENQSVVSATPSHLLASKVHLKQSVTGREPTSPPSCRSILGLRK